MHTKTLSIITANRQPSPKGTGNICCIVIPIYKNKLTEYEITSLKQCCNILGKHPIIFVTHRKLDCSYYDSICCNADVSYRFEYFHSKYFFDVLSYNALMLSRNFYKRFYSYDYMLIYQLDAYVFKDELEYWCKKGYDYIGAPWLKLNKLKTMHEFADPPAVGNGGFSLRNIKIAIEKHPLRFSILSFMDLFQSYYNKISLKSKRNFYYFIPMFYLRCFLKLLKTIFCKIYTTDNEDVLWCCLLYKKGNIPPAIEATKFSFELDPEYLYRINNKNLPFGCHACFTYKNYLFYKKYVKENF